MEKLYYNWINDDNLNPLGYYWSFDVKAFIKNFTDFILVIGYDSELIVFNSEYAESVKVESLEHFKKLQPPYYFEYPKK
jgi:hypothetical protein